MRLHRNELDGILDNILSAAAGDEERQEARSALLNWAAGVAIAAKIDEINRFTNAYEAGDVTGMFDVYAHFAGRLLELGQMQDVLTNEG